MIVVFQNSSYQPTCGNRSDEHANALNEDRHAEGAGKFLNAEEIAQDVRPLTDDDAGEDAEEDGVDDHVVIGGRQGPGECKQRRYAGGQREEERRTSADERSGEDEAGQQAAEGQQINDVANCLRYHECNFTLQISWLLLNRHITRHNTI